ncbi:MAG: hypothetical protein K2I42_02680 [Anaeroplasmataceae bacterium]|nr:hypothetical protein [Anaeroplasmataceae bacterium]
MENKSYPMHELGIAKSEDLKYEIKSYLDNKTHSSAYLKVCSNELKRLGHMDLSLVMESIAHAKLNFEAMLMEAFGMKEDIRLNLNNVLVRAEEDVKLARKIADLAMEKKEWEVYNLMYELAKTEAENLTAIMGVLNRMIKDRN